MTDVFAPAAEAAPAPAPAATPMSEPAPVTQSAEPAPAQEAPARTAFDENLDDFFSRDLLAEMGAEPAPAAAPVPAPAAPVASPGVATPAAGAPTNPQPAPANGGTPPAETTQPAPEVDPNLLIQMMSGTEAAPAAPAPAAAGTTPAPASAPAEEERFAPFTMQMGIPDQLLDTVLSSEDPTQQKQALTAMMAALGNATVAVIEQRFKEHHAPRMAEQFMAAQTARQGAAAVEAHFYGANPELKQYAQIVTKAGQTYLAANPTVKYDDKTAEAIANLARAALTQMGVTLPPKGAAPAASAAPAAPAQPTTSAAPAAAAPPTPYLTGGASPGGALETHSGDRNDPGSLFEDMMGAFG